MCYRKTAKYGFAGFMMSCAMLVSSSAAVIVLGQEAQPKKAPATKRAPSAGRDPFKKYEPPRVIRKATGQVMPPTIQERIELYRAQKQAAMNARMPAPKPTTALLLNEIQVIGISRTPRGYAAIIEATPIKLSYVIYPGESFFDGQLVAIEDNRLVFRRETVFTDGRRERSVELKPLRKPSAVNAMNTAPSTPAQQTDGPKPDDKSVATAKP